MSPLPASIYGAVPPSQAAERLVGLKQAVEAASNRIDEEVLAPVRDVITRAEGRLARSTEHTVIALAGSTGSGKSSLFNAIVGMELAGAGVRRPTTSWALACAWGPDGADQLLDWMEIPPQHRVMRSEGIDADAVDDQLRGLILIDLPDHDSTEMAHRLEMERLVEYADLVIWVLDPQKYADASIHERYLQSMSAHKDTTLVVLNQIDRIPFELRRSTLSDVQRIINEGGLDSVSVMGVSATRGDGVDDLRRELAARVRQKDASRKKLAGDFFEASQSLARVGGTKILPGFDDDDVAELLTKVRDAAGVDSVADSIHLSVKRGISRVTNWPPVRLANRIMKGSLSLSSSQVPSVQRAELNQAIREFASIAQTDASRPWADAIALASTKRHDEIADAVDQVLSASQANSSIPVAARILGWLQSIVFVIGVAAAAWWGLEQFITLPDIGLGGEVLGYDRLLVVAASAFVVGLLLAGVGQAWAGVAAKKRSAAFAETLTQQLGDVVDREVVGRVGEVLADFAEYRSGLAIAMR